MHEKEKRVLILENDSDMLYILERAFDQKGYKVESCTQGTGIVEFKHVWPDVFILDKDLAVIDGLAVTKFLRLRSETNKIPIIMISAYPVENEAHRAGVDIFLSKPFQLSHLLEVVDGLIQRRLYQEQLM